MSLFASDTITIPPLLSGGVMLSYRCSNACRHCLYRCSPAMPDEWMSPETMERVFEALGREPRPPSIHLAGGEPTMRFDLLERAVRLAIEAGIPIDYVETNAFWCEEDGATRRQLERLRDEGLQAILVSCSMFHNEFVPFERTRRCVETAREVFGPYGVYVYLPHLYETLSQMPNPDKTHTLAEFCRWTGIPEWSRDIPTLYGVIPSGRATQALRKCYVPQPASRLAGVRCRTDLLDTTHFHIDPQGDLFTGLCAGLAPATIDDLHPAITRESHPVFCELCENGPFGLMRMAEERHGYKPREDGYVSKCDLCFDVRRHLHATGKYPELRPAAFYEA